MPAPGHVQLFVPDVATGACRQITTGPADIDGALAWTASGAALLFGSQRGDPVDRI